MRRGTYTGAGEGNKHQAARGQPSVRRESVSSRVVRDLERGAVVTPGVLTCVSDTLVGRAPVHDGVAHVLESPSQYRFPSTSEQRRLTHRHCVIVSFEPSDVGDFEVL